MDGVLTVAGAITGALSSRGSVWTAIVTDDGDALATDNGLTLITDAVTTGDNAIVGSLSAVQSLQGEITTAESVYYPTYSGSYEITPTQQTQTIPINGLLAADDITVNPIPSNYGLITWDGSTLTVS